MTQLLRRSPIFPPPFSVLFRSTPALWKASELSGFALRLARRTRAAEGSDAGLREAGDR